MSYIKCPLNYVGGKYKILEQVFAVLPDKIHTFVDLFAGGFNVGINVQADTIICNDCISYLIELYKYFIDVDTSVIIHEINDRINEYKLDYYNAEGYYALRNRYNKDKDIVDLLVLTFFSFNHHMRFNSKGMYNVPFGKAKSRYNPVIENNLIRFCNALQTKNVILSNKDFTDVDLSGLSKDDLVYCDPPYLISKATYCDNWTDNDEIQLLNLLDNLDKHNVRFALSNVLEHKRRSNDLLIAWSKKYNVHPIDISYFNCSCCMKNANTKTSEVIITNF